jgi:hypothetical protein
MTTSPPGTCGGLHAWAARYRSDVAVMTVRNGSTGWLCLWLEPLREDRWLRSGETFQITSDYAGD